MSSSCKLLFPKQQCSRSNPLQCSSQLSNYVSLAQQEGVVSLDVQAQLSSAKREMATPAQPPDLEPYLHELSGALFAVVGTLAGYICQVYWENGSDFGLYKTIGLSLALAVIVYVVLSVPQILRKAFANKLYTALAVFVGFLLFACLSRLYRSLSTVIDPTTSTTPVSGKVELTQQITSVEESISELPVPLIDGGRDGVRMIHQEQLEEGSRSQTVEQNTGVDSISTNKATPALSTFNGDCTKHSKQLISQTSLTSPEKHRIEGQVDMFKRTILLKGKPTQLALFDEYSGEYEGDAIDIMNRKHNKGATSSISAKDALEKALTKMCETLVTEGLHQS